MSDRSVHAKAISNSVVVTGNGNSVVATFGDSGARIALTRRQVRAPDRRRAPRPGDPPRELDLFAPDADALPLLGRETIMADLRAWLDDPTDLSAHALIGQAGSGKTRLALELCRAVDPPDNSGAWRAAFVSPSAIEPIVEMLATRAFVWDRPTLLVLDYAATAHRALARWLDALAPNTQATKLRFLLLEREAPEGFGWWDDLIRPGLHGDSGRRDVFWTPRPELLPGLADHGQRRDLFQAALVAAHGLRGAPEAPPPVSAAGRDAAFDRALAEQRFENPLNLVMAGVIACDHTPLGALGLRRLDAAMKLADRERHRLDRLAEAERLPVAAVRHMVAFNGLAGGLPVKNLPDLVARELAAWGSIAAADARAVASLLVQEFPALRTSGDEPRLATIQPDLIGESVIVRAFEGEPWLAAEAIPTVRRAYALGQTRAGEALTRIVQDFAYALEDRDAAEADRKRGVAVMAWLTDLADRADNPASLLPLVFALPRDTLVLREASASLTARLADQFRQVGDASVDLESAATLAPLLNNLANRLSDLGRREAALAAAEEAVRLCRALAEARPDAFTPNLAMSLNNLANMLSDLGRREAALAAAEEAVRLRRALAEARPDAFTPDLATSLNNLGSLLSALGRREAALAAAEEAVRLYRALAEARPDAFTPDLATSLNNLGSLLSDLGRREAALAAAEEAVRLRRALAEARPDAFTPNLATSLNNLANMLSDLGRREAALAAAEEAVRLRRALAEARPDAFTPDLATSLNNLGSLLSALGRREAALAAAEEAVRLRRALAEARPDAFTPDLATSLNNLGSLLSDLGRREAALAAAEEAVRLRRALAEARPDAFTPDLATSLNNLGSLLSALGRREAALAAAEEAVRLRRALAEARPDAFTPDLATSLNNLANMLSALGRREAALAAAEEAVRLRRALAEARPDAFMPDLATSLSNLANRLSDLGRREAALAAAEEGVRLYRALAEARPEVFDVDLARSLWVLGDLQAETNNVMGGAATLEGAVRTLTPMFERFPAPVRGMMLGLCQSYVTVCQKVGREPDGALLAPVVAVLQRIDRAGPT